MDNFTYKLTFIHMIKRKLCITLFKVEPEDYWKLKNLKLMKCNKLFYNNLLYVTTIQFKRSINVCLNK